MGYSDSEVLAIVEKYESAIDYEKKETSRLQHELEYIKTRMDAIEELFANQGNLLNQLQGENRALRLVIDKMGDSE